MARAEACREADVVTEFPMKGVFIIVEGLIQFPKGANQQVMRPPESNLETSVFHSLVAAEQKGSRACPGATRYSRCAKWAV